MKQFYNEFIKLAIRYMAFTATMLPFSIAYALFYVRNGGKDDVLVFIGCVLLGVICGGIVWNILERQQNRK